MHRSGEVMEVAGTARHAAAHQQAATGEAAGCGVAEGQHLVAV